MPFSRIPVAYDTDIKHDELVRMINEDCRQQVSRNTIRPVDQTEEPEKSDKPGETIEARKENASMSTELKVQVLCHVRFNHYSPLSNGFEKIQNSLASVFKSLETTTTTQEQQ